MSQSNEIDPAFGHWLAGFIDGEGSFAISTSRKRPDPRAIFTLEVREDERPVLEEIVQRTGLGRLTLRKKRENSPLDGKPQLTWTVSTRADVVGLVLLLERYPLCAKKRRDYLTWCEAVRVQTQRRHEPGAHDQSRNMRINHRLWDLKRQLEADRKYQAPDSESAPPTQPNDSDCEEVRLFEL